MVLYIGITAFIALFGIVYEQFSHHVDTFYMWFAWIWPLIFGFVPYLLLYVLKAPRVPGLLSECFYNLGVALLHHRVRGPSAPARSRSRPHPGRDCGVAFRRAASAVAERTQTHPRTPQKSAPAPRRPPAPDLPRRLQLPALRIRADPAARGDRLAALSRRRPAARRTDEALRVPGARHLRIQGLQTGHAVRRLLRRLRRTARGGVLPVRRQDLRAGGHGGRPRGLVVHADRPHRRS